MKTKEIKSSFGFATSKDTTILEYIFKALYVYKDAIGAPIDIAELIEEVNALRNFHGLYNMKALRKNGYSRFVSEAQDACVVKQPPEHLVTPSVTFEQEPEEKVITPPVLSLEERVAALEYTVSKHEILLEPKYKPSVINTPVKTIEDKQPSLFSFPSLNNSYPAVNLVHSSKDFINLTVKYENYIAHIKKQFESSANIKKQGVTISHANVWANILQYAMVSDFSEKLLPPEERKAMYNAYYQAKSYYKTTGRKRFYPAEYYLDITHQGLLLLDPIIEKMYTEGEKITIAKKYWSYPSATPEVVSGYPSWSKV